MEKTIESMRKKIRKNSEYYYADLKVLSEDEILSLVNELNDMMIYWYEKCDKYKEELSWYRTRRKR